MSDLKTEILPADATGMARAAALLGQGQLVAIPTETVYGLAGDARSDMACARIFAAKGRPRFNPLIVHLASVEAAEELVEMTDLARDLAGAFWPGALTLVLPLRAGHGLSQLVTAGLDTLAIRLPAHPVARALLEECGFPLAAPSANPSGRISPTSAGHVLTGLEGRIAAVLDGGECGVGLESTILAPGETSARLLREGGIPREAIEPLTGPLRLDTTPGKVTAPGQMSSHYAPRTPVLLDQETGQPNSISIGFGPHDGDLNLSPAGDLVEAAATLFATLHKADQMAHEISAKTIQIAPIPETGLGRAINDRLRRAAAPKT